MQCQVPGQVDQNIDLIVAHSFDEAKGVLNDLGLPLIVRPAFIICMT